MYESVAKAPGERWPERALQAAVGDSERLGLPLSPFRSNDAIGKVALMGPDPDDFRPRRTCWPP